MKTLDPLSIAAALFVAAALAGPAQVAAQERSPFDGAWDVTLTCPALHDDDDDAKGYVHRFPAEVKGGVLRGVHGSEGEPSYHLLTGTIGADGAAALVLEGIVNNPGLFGQQRPARQALQLPGAGAVRARGRQRPARRQAQVRLRVQAPSGRRLSRRRAAPSRPLLRPAERRMTHVHPGVRTASS